MKRFLGTLLVVLSFFCFSAEISRAQSDNLSDEDSKGINQTVAGYIDDYNRHDAQAIGVWFTKDADYVNSGGMTDHGGPAVAQRFVTRFNGTLKTAHRTYVVKSIHLVDPQVALLYATSEVTGRKKADGSDEPVAKSLYELVLVKQGGKWLIANFHESDLP